MSEHVVTTFARARRARGHDKSTETNCARTYSSFRLSGDRLHPERVTAAVHIHPDLARAKDALLPAGKHGQPRRQRSGVWLISSKDVVDSTSAERHLLYLLDALEPIADELTVLRREQQLRADFSCYWGSATGNSGPELTAECLGRIAALGASLDFDFYDLSSAAVDQPG